MPHRLIDRIREKIRLKEYDMTVHAMEEMADDDLDVLDIEEAVLSGRVVRSNKDDPRGTRYTVEGLARDGEKTRRYRRPIPWDFSVPNHHRI